ncbi:hypothetical protein EVJ58_g10359 [Rhodofomes roseus]|uniref:Uncharacterized protein n=1 Tax=Rhodofomes roseus TaxID=34475 RepID=A0A4Y9XPY1_9APHY|nr:hypothetical protein EVJ58_g10359 [Rhodofomes roseus]
MQTQHASDTLLPLYEWPPNCVNVSPPIYVNLGGPVGNRGIQKDASQLQSSEALFPLPVTVSCKTLQQAEHICELQTCFDVAGEQVGPSRRIIKDIVLALIRSEDEIVVPLGSTKQAYPVLKGRFVGVAVDWPYCYSETKASYVRSTYNSNPTWTKLPTAQQAIIYYLTGGGEGTGVAPLPRELAPSIIKILAALFTAPEGRTVPEWSGIPELEGELLGHVARPLCSASASVYPPDTARSPNDIDAVESAITQDSAFHTDVITESRFTSAGLSLSRPELYAIVGIIVSGTVGYTDGA